MITGVAVSDSLQSGSAQAAVDPLTHAFGRRRRFGIQNPVNHGRNDGIDHVVGTGEASPRAMARSIMTCSCSRTIAAHLPTQPDVLAATSRINARPGAEDISSRYISPSQQVLMQTALIDRHVRA